MNGKSPNQPPEAETSPLFVEETKSSVSSEPDEHTGSDTVFFPDGAPNQVFRFDLGIVSYGTDDKSHAAALILSVMLGVLMLALFVGGILIDRAWIPDALQILGPAFTLVAGVAIGQSTSRNS